MQSGKIEIMAPVGSFESLSAALNAGCNSVYFGVEQLNMRARSSVNFTTDDLKEIVRRCNEKGVRSYLTINTVLYDHDIRLMKTLVDQAKESGVSAVIASDHAVMSYSRKIGLPVHISTQANVTNIETIEFYSAFADVMVLSRELSLRQVAHITREIERQQITGPSGELIRIEVFAHGALCMAVSGKCYLSLHSHNASANRGACIQNCRKTYVVTDDEGTELAIDNEYIMSAKDLCTIGFIDKVVEAGVQILKIEGRGRSADYVDTTISCYREAVDAIEAGTYTADKIEDWTNRLAKVYNRGFWDGYYLGRKMGEWNNTYGSKATEKKIYIGRGVKYFGKIGVGEFQLEAHQLNKGDKILITGPTTGVVYANVEELRKEDLSVEYVSKGDTFSMPIENAVRGSDKLYKIVDA
ncbi:U32 family peptidase [Fulvivirga maritima]|uniref:peptidase U32 family protein n=1 Tax=Fulvivirga maritima TaxID=2904247 RepID=UPI001F3E3595|nr:peptidase U32 family protein [Fulvivirga maritima]UII25051.1 U32 family peptidase [Fulvivirga maritima]